MAFKLTILGCGSATPTSQRNPTAQVLNVHERFFLLDCGEGTQLQMIRYGVKAHKINHIFISHLHGDHYLGLMGLLSSMHLFGRRKEMHIYCPEQLREIIELQLEYSGTQMRFPIQWHYLRTEGKQKILDLDYMEVHAFPVEHRIDCWGFRFDEKPRPLNIKKEKLGEYRIPVSKIEGIKLGDDFITEDGLVIKNDELTLSPEPLKSYAYSADTRPNKSVIKAVKDVDLLYHEATFLSYLEERAKETFHSTAKQAAEVAIEANAERLMIGHFSSRYKQSDELLAEAKAVFENTIAAEDGLSVEI